MKRRHRNNFKLLDSYSYFVPGFRELLLMCLLLLGGVLLGNGITLAFKPLFGSLMDPKQMMELSNLIAYPIMFIPAMIYAASQSHRNEMFEPEFTLDGKNFGRFGGALLALVATLATLCLSLVSDSINYAMPQMPQWLKDALETLTDGNIFISILMASVFAPFFEEWLCRGICLRGLLHCRRKDGSRGISPVWAIVISAAFFALIHANPWQAIPAFLFGLLFGFVYYKTGSLKLTMLMHCANNTMTIVLSHIDSLGDYEFFIDFLGVKLYCIMAAASCILLILALKLFNSIPSATSVDES